VLSDKYKIYEAPTFEHGGPMFSGLKEPSIIDRIAALADPDSDLARRIAEYDEIHNTVLFGALELLGPEHAKLRRL
jgi:hypothetical protein